MKHVMLVLFVVAGCREKPSRDTVRGVPPDVVHFAAGSFRGSRLICGPGMGMSKTTLEAPAFLIDRTLTTCTAYADCVSTGKCRPLVAYRHDAIEPMCAEGFAVVGWSDAADFCAFAGGTVPTSIHWQRAIRGKDGLVRASTDSIDDGDPCTHPTSLTSKDKRCRHVSPDGVEYVLESRFREHLFESSCPNTRYPGKRTVLYAQSATLLTSFALEDTLPPYAMFRCVYPVLSYTQL